VALICEHTDKVRRDRAQQAPAMSCRRAVADEARALERKWIAELPVLRGGPVNTDRGLSCIVRRQVGPHPQGSDSIQVTTSIVLARWRVARVP